MNDRRTRRSFLGHAGAALAAPLAATTAVAAEPHGALAARLAELEDANAIRALLAASLANPAQLRLDAGVRGIVADRDDSITVAADGTATARVACTVVTITPIENSSTLVEMARLQGDGVIKRSERRLLTSSFVKRSGTWHLEHSELTT